MSSDVNTMNSPRSTASHESIYSDRSENRSESGQSSKTIFDEDAMSEEVSTGCSINVQLEENNVPDCSATSQRSTRDFDPNILDSPRDDEQWYVNRDHGWWERKGLEVLRFSVCHNDIRLVCWLIPFNTPPHLPQTLSLRDRRFLSDLWMTAAPGPLVTSGMNTDDLASAIVKFFQYRSVPVVSSLQLLLGGIGATPNDLATRLDNVVIQNIQLIEFSDVIRHALGYRAQSIDQFLYGIRSIQKMVYALLVERPETTCIIESVHKLHLCRNPLSTWIVADCLFQQSTLEPLEFLRQPIDCIRSLFSERRITFRIMTRRLAYLTVHYNRSRTNGNPRLPTSYDFLDFLDMYDLECSSMIRMSCWLADKERDFTRDGPYYNYRWWELVRDAESCLAVDPALRKTLSELIIKLYWQGNQKDIPLAIWTALQQKLFVTESNSAVGTDLPSSLDLEAYKRALKDKVACIEDIEMLGTMLHTW